MNNNVNKEELKAAMTEIIEKGEAFVATAVKFEEKYKEHEEEINEIFDKDDQFADLLARGDKIEETLDGLM